MSLSEETTDSSPRVECPVSQPSTFAVASESRVSQEIGHEDMIVKDYLRKKEPLFGEVDDLQEKVSVISFNCFL